MAKEVSSHLVLLAFTVEHPASDSSCSAILAILCGTEDMQEVVSAYADGTHKYMFHYVTTLLISGAMQHLKNTKATRLHLIMYYKQSISFFISELLHYCWPSCCQNYMSTCSGSQFTSLFWGHIITPPSLVSEFNLLITILPPSMLGFY